MAWRAAIVDDSEADAEYVEKLLKAWARERQTDLHTERFASAERFLFRYEDEKVWELLLLDIEMGEMDGVQLAKKLRQTNRAVQIVFITGFPDFMAEGYEVAALHYLMKPVCREKLFAVLDRAAENLGRQEKRLRVAFDRQEEWLPLRQITYIEARKQYVVIHTQDGEYRMKATLADTEKELDEYFLRCQRSFVVNLREVLRIGRDCVELKDGTQVPISRGMAQTVGKEIIRLF